MTVTVIDFDLVAHRSDPRGALVRFEASSDQAIVRVTLALEGNGEPPIVTTFETGNRSDGRYNRALAPKWSVNGTFPLVVTATDALGRQGSARCTPGVTVGY